MTVSNLTTKEPTDNDWNGLSPLDVKKYLPFTDWLLNYRMADLPGDIMAGLIVAIMLVPQSMAYALLAGLPPQVGLYASILPLFIYGLLGSSRTLAVGPVAIVSLMVGASVNPLAGGDAALYLQLVVTLALLVGLIQILMGILRIGFLVNFLSHPVLVGFTAAAAIVIGASQVKNVLGVSMARGEFIETVGHTFSHLGQTNLVTLGIGLASIGILLFFKYQLSGLLQSASLPTGLITPLSKSAPLVVVLLGTWVVGQWRLNDRFDVGIVGTVPTGLPPLSLPILEFHTWQLLLPTALAISFVSYMESFSVAKSLASKRRQKVDADQELIGLGAANLAATFAGGYPVTGGFSRSVVNFAAGANTGLASMITAGLVLITVLLLTPLIYYLPKAVLATIILVAVVNLIDLKAALHIWRYNKADGLALILTFLAVLAIGVEQGILIGAATSLLLYIWRTSRPHTAVVGRIGDSEIYRNVLRYDVQTWPQIIAIRIDESLYFANTKHLEETVLGMVAEQQNVEHVILIGTAINFIDASALETLESLLEELESANVYLHLAAIKGPVLDSLRQIGFIDKMGAERIHFSTHDAIIALGYAKPVSQSDCSPGEAAKRAQHVQVYPSRTPKRRRQWQTLTG